jgi:hypothetical protein
MELSATYSPEDNKLRLYSSARLDSETYSRLKAAGFKWAPRQQLFVAPMWTPQRADLLMELCGEIGDEDKSLVKRAEERAERFENFSENRAKDAESARKKVDSIVEHIPFGQPILVGHHSERRARKDAQRIDEGMRKSIKMWDTSKYWTTRAEAAIQHAKYKELPAVRARRIKGLESDERKYAKYLKDYESGLRAWSNEGLTKDQALMVARHSDFRMPRKEGDRPDFAQNPSAWDALSNSYPNLYAPRTVEEVVERARVHYRSSIRWAQRWIEHIQNRLTYERAMLAADGGIVADKNAPQVGGACKCWASPRGGWSLVQKVNKVSVTVLDNWGNGGADFTRTIPFHKLTAVMSRGEVDAAREAGLLAGECPRGFILRSKPSQAEAVSEPAKPVQEEPKVAQPPAIPSGIQTPRGPLPHSQQELFRPQAGQSQKRGMGL